MIYNEKRNKDSLIKKYIRWNKKKIEIKIKDKNRYRVNDKKDKVKNDTKWC